MIDLLYLIFNGTDKEFRDEYYEKLIDFYYTQFSDALKRLGIDPEKTYSKEDFYFELKEVRCLLLSSSITFIVAPMQSCVKR